MKKIILSFILLSFILSSCEKEEDKTFNATVIGPGLDCGSYLIRLNEELSGFIQNSFDNTFYEINLPEEQKVKGKLIYVEFRLPENNELMVCKTLGFSYPQIYITKAE